MLDSRKKTHRDHTHLKERSRRGALNALFGRSTLIILLLAAQIALLLSLFTRWQYSLLAYGGTYLISAIMALLLINRPMSPGSRQTWLILILLAPVVGTLLYLYVDNDIGHHLVRNRLAQIERETASLLPEPECTEAQSPELQSLARYTYRFGGFPLATNTQAKYLSSGEDMFEALLQALERAEKFIFLEFFIIDEGEMWQAVLDILERKARQGVEVRVMYDGTCAVFRLPYRYPEKLKAMGIQCKMFSPLRPLVSTHYNNRDHRKIVVVDGHTAFTGGINLADEYINRKTLYGHWKDVAVQLTGPAARSFTLMFLRMWHITEHAVDYERYLGEPLPDDLPAAPGCVLPYADSPFDDERVGESVYLDIINRAERYVHIMTPYLILDQDMISALSFAAKRGVDVRLILPGIPDKKYAFALAYTHYRELLCAGVRIYEYEPGFVHAKVFVSDDAKAVIGSINLDYRSLLLHFECAAYLYQVPAIADIEKDFHLMLTCCRAVTEETVKREKLSRKLTGFLLKLFAPLM